MVDFKTRLKKLVAVIVSSSPSNASRSRATYTQDCAAPRHLGGGQNHAGESSLGSSGLRVESVQDTIHTAGACGLIRIEGDDEVGTHVESSSISGATETEDRAQDDVEIVTDRLPGLANSAPENVHQPVAMEAAAAPCITTTNQSLPTSESSLASAKLEHRKHIKTNEQDTSGSNVSDINHLLVEKEHLQAALNASKHVESELMAQNRANHLKYEALLTAKQQELEAVHAKALADILDRDTRILELEGVNSLWQNRDQDHSRSVAQLQHQNRDLDDNLRAQRGMIEDLMKERELTNASRLKIDTFDSSIDRVSEAQLIGTIEDVNSLVDDLVAGLIEDVSSFISTHPSGPFSDHTMVDAETSGFLKYALEADPGSDNWGLLVDCLLHQKITECLHATIYSSSFGVPLPQGKDGESMEALHKYVIGNENWRAAQRWRSVTAKALDGIASASTWQSIVAALARDTHDCLAAVTRQSYAALDPLHDAIEEGLRKTFDKARMSSLTIATDMVSSRIRVVLGSAEHGCKEVLWPEMEGKADDVDIGDYTLGLLKVDEHGKATALLPSKVATYAVIRYVLENS